MKHVMGPLEQIILLVRNLGPNEMSRGKPNMSGSFAQPCGQAQFVH